jgi:hypothetical protein
MTFPRPLASALLGLAFVLVVLVPANVCVPAEAIPASWELRDHEANHTGNGTDHHHHHHEEEALLEIFAMFDQDNDTRLSEEELELLHATMFPEFRTSLVTSLDLRPEATSKLNIAAH